MRAPRDGIGVLGDGINDGIQDGIDDAVRQRLGLVFAVEKRTVCLRSRYRGRVAHVMLERIVDIELDIVHDCDRGGRGPLLQDAREIRRLEHGRWGLDKEVGRDCLLQYQIEI